MADAFHLLLPIRLVTVEAEIRGHISSSDERITDILQRGDTFRILPEGARPDREHWLEISPNEIQLVVPPPLVSPPERRKARQPSTVFVRAGPYEVTGTAHLQPGSEADLVSRSSQPFLPLTDAVLVAPDHEPEPLDVIIVNLRLTTDYRVV
jgi:hypothetical protein